MSLPALFLLPLSIVPMSQDAKDGQETAVTGRETPPVAPKVPHKLEIHGDTRVDEYYWLNQREDPAVIDYLEQENAYTENRMAHTSELREALFDEIKGRIQQTDMSVPYREDGYFYYRRDEKEKEYAIYCRKQGSLEADEEVMLDVNELAEGQPYCSVRARAVSPGQDLLAYAVDLVGRRKYTLRFKDLTTGALRDDVIPKVTGNVVWAADNKTVFYTRQDPATLRSYQIFRHTLGEDPAADPLVFEEQDETFSCFVGKTKSREFLTIVSNHTLRTEVRILRADNPRGEWQVFLPRAEGEHKYSINHFAGRFYIRSNEGAPNYRLLSTAEGSTDQDDWEVLIPHRDDVYLAGFELFQDHLVLSERKAGLMELRVRRHDGSDEHYLDFGEPAYRASVSINPMLDTKVLRFSYTSLTTPNSTFDYDMDSRAKTLLKEEEVLGGFDKKNYQTDRLYAKAEDGESIPVSVVWRKGIKRDSSNPLLLYGYGSYGATIDASFRSSRLSLIDRGFVFAIAHVRGSQVYGRRWYDDGRLLNKRNTFTDFIAAAEHLVEQGWTSPERLFAQGGSAGGLLMGAVVNLRPDLFHGVLAAVPFVDVVTTMLDESIPLTTSEYDEWGNPNDEEYYRYMLSYSPYDNVAKAAYPHMLVTTGLHDSQVQYWEPAKWVARLRDRKTDDHRLLLKTNMDAGHGGASGRYKRYEETAFQYAFLIDLVEHADQ